MSARNDNTYWISVWIINDGDYYHRAREVAAQARDADDYTILQRHITDILNSRATETVRVIAREMSEADLDNTDWAEVADDLITE